MKHFINILDHSTAELEQILVGAERLKARRRAGIQDRFLLGKTMGMLFEKPSTRTRVSLETAMATLGGTALELSGRLEKREPLKDLARVLSRYVDVIAIRTFAHTVVETFAEWSSVPVINALSDTSHPTQALADILTLRERLGDLTGKTLAFVGDGNNVARSLVSLCAKLGLRFVLASPEEYRLPAAHLEAVRAACPGADIQQTSDPATAVKGADAVYTDVWVSMGEEEKSRAKKKVFLPFQVNAALMKQAPADALVMHCLPAHRGEEIADEVIESPASVVFDQAENRMHINRALLALLLAEQSG